MKIKCKIGFKDNNEIHKMRNKYIFDCVNTRNMTSKGCRKPLAALGTEIKSLNLLISIIRGCRIRLTGSGRKIAVNYKIDCMNNVTRNKSL